MTKIQIERSDLELLTQWFQALEHEGLAVPKSIGDLWERITALLETKPLTLGQLVAFPCPAQDASGRHLIGCPLCKDTGVIKQVDFPQVCVADPFDGMQCIAPWHLTHTLHEKKT